MQDIVNIHKYFVYKLEYDSFVTSDCYQNFHLTKENIQATERKTIINEGAKVRTSMHQNNVKNSIFVLMHICIFIFSIRYVQYCF